MLIFLGARKLNVYTDFYGVATIQYLVSLSIRYLDFYFRFFGVNFFLLNKFTTVR